MLKRKTKIVATLGPATRAPDKIEGLCLAGVNVFRLNLSHGQHDEHRESVKKIRDIEKKLGQPIAIMLDLQGPKFRIGTFQKGSVPLRPQQSFQLDLDATPGDSTRVLFNHPEIFPLLSPGATILIDDGRVWLRVDEPHPHSLICTVLLGTELSDRKGVNFPTLSLSSESMPLKDEKDLEFCSKLDIDWLAISFVQTANDMERVRKKVPSSVRLLAKIEKPQAIQNLESIMDSSDAVMVARGDLGIEISMEKLPEMQKNIIRKAQEYGKPVIVATQMLESMIHSPIPTRAEVSDVANAVYEGADAVMLSAESALGRYPLQAVQMMDKIIRQVESGQDYLKVIRSNIPLKKSFCITSSLPGIIDSSQSPVIVTASLTGKTALTIACERANAAVVALTPDRSVARALCLVWGVYAYCVPLKETFSVEDWTLLFKTLLLTENLAAPGEAIAIVAGYPFSLNSSANFVGVLSL
jgi:pyruvate kinase